jgi:hypothetical protein
MIHENPKYVIGSMQIVNLAEKYTLAYFVWKSVAKGEKLYPPRQAPYFFTLGINIAKNKLVRLLLQTFVGLV